MDDLKVEFSIKDIEPYNEILYTMLNLLGDQRIPEYIRSEYASLISEPYKKLFGKCGDIE